MPDDTNVLETQGPMVFVKGPSRLQRALKNNSVILLEQIKGRMKSIGCTTHARYECERVVKDIEALLGIHVGMWDVATMEEIIAEQDRLHKWSD